MTNDLNSTHSLQSEIFTNIRELIFNTQLVEEKQDVTNNRFGKLSKNVQRLNIMVDQRNSKTFKALIEGPNNIGDAQIKSKVKDALKSKIEDRKREILGLVAENYANSLEKSFATIFLPVLHAGRMTSDLQAEMPSSGVGFMQEDLGAQLQLKGIIRKAQQKLKKSLSGCIDAWGPNLALSGEDLDTEHMINLKDQVINSMGDNFMSKEERSVTEGDISYLISGITDIWWFQTERMTTMWEVTLNDVFNELKGEFPLVSSHFNDILRTLRDNASEVASIIAFLRRDHLTLGTKLGLSKVQGWKERWTDQTLLPQQMLSENSGSRLAQLNENRARIGDLVAIVMGRANKEKAAQGNILTRLSNKTPLKFIKGVPVLGKALLAMDLLGGAFDVASQLWMTEGERDDLKTAQLDELSRRVRNQTNLSMTNPSKYIGGLLLGYDFLRDSLFSALGGTQPSAMEYLKAFELGFKHDGDDLKEALDEALGVSKRTEEARVRRNSEREAVVDPFIDRNTGLLDQTIERDSKSLGIETVGEILSRIGANIDENFSFAEAELGVRKHKLLLQGLQEDSQAMRDALEDYFSANLGVLDEAIEEIKWRKERTSPGKSRRVLELRQMELEAQRAQLEYERLQAQYTRFEEIITKHERSLGFVESRFSRQHYEGLLRGERVHSPLMRAIEDNRLHETLMELNSTLSLLKGEARTLPVSHGKWEETMLEIHKLEAERAQLEYERYMNQFSAFDDVMERLGDDTALLDAISRTTKADAILAGASEDSAMIRAIDRNRSNEMANIMSLAQEELWGVLRGIPEGTKQWTQIWLQIQQIEAEKKTILADMRKILGSQPTFNLLSGIEPVTYYEHMTKDNTHRNVTVRSGDTFVSVTIDQVNNGQDIERLATEVERAVNRANQGMVNQFANDVKKGLGKTYRKY